MRLALALTVTLVLPVLPAGAEAPAAKKPLVLERVSGDPPLVPRSMLEVAWRDAQRFSYLVASGADEDAPATLWEYDTVAGTKTRLVDRIPIPHTDAKPGDPDKPRTLPLRGYTWNPAGNAILLSGENDLWLYDLVKGAPHRLTNDVAKEENASFSPDGSRLAYVKKNDLYTLDLASREETRLTITGTDHVLNGKLDWVYQEELGNRRGRPYAWAPDSSVLVYLRLDESRVPEFPIVDFTAPGGKVLMQRYPRPGDPNAIPSVHIVDMTGKELAARTFAPDDLYVAPELTFTADSRWACFMTLNRAQTELKVEVLSRQTGSTKTLHSETDPAWVNLLHAPRFLKDGSGYLFLSERSGFVHLYRFGMTGIRENAVTKGPWMIDGAPEIDEAHGLVYFVATEKDPRERHVYRAALDGTGFTRLSEGRGSHDIKLSPGGAFYVDTFSDILTPPKSALVAADGKRVALVDDPPTELAAFAVGTTELGSFYGADGMLFYTRLVKPADFDPAKKYPAVVFVYGGPHGQVVRDRWGSTSLFDLLMASKGILVWAMDNRGSFGRGHEFETPLLKDMGETELKDQIEGIAELKKLPFVDGERLGITGWSYGGYMTLYAATHAGSLFRCAAAGAPVVDWRLYDSIYTERYMKLPQENAAGYKAAAPLAAAANLGTKLLILHGTSDDNVHMANSVAFIDELMKARKDFTFAPLPRQKHGPRKEALLYRNQRLLEFFEKNLLP
jgi:dipeptidyl-peptidase 4